MTTSELLSEAAWAIRSLRDSFPIGDPWNYRMSDGDVRRVRDALCHIEAATGIGDDAPFPSKAKPRSRRTARATGDKR